MKKSIYMLLCAAALVSCGQPKQQQEAVVDVATSGNPIFEGWYADPEGIIYGDTYWVFPTCTRYLCREMGEASYVGAVYHQ